MTVALWLCSVPLIAEFAVAPLNLWSGRTIANFTRFTGLSPRLATWLFAPAKLAGALLLAAGLAISSLGLAGAAVTVLISAIYLVRLTDARRRHPDGIAAFSITLILALVVLALQRAR
jgi:hypothetical protein